MKSRVVLKNHRAAFLAPLLIAFCCCLTSAASVREAKIHQGLDLIRNGCFQEGREVFKELIDLDPSMPDAYFFISFSYFIHLIYNPSDLENRHELESNLQHSIELAEQRVVKDRNDHDAQLFLGTSYLLESYYKALSKEALSAAFLAKKGKKILETLLENDPDCYDAYFGLGIYNYYADRVPSFVKGIRFLLFLPGGNIRQGLSQLKTSSLKAKYFNVESSLMIAEIYSNKFEKDYYSSYMVLSSYARSEKDYLLILHALAKLQIKIMKFDEAKQLLETALLKANERKADQDVLTYMKFHLAKCYFFMNRADKALPYFYTVLLKNQNCNDFLLEETLKLSTQSLLLTGQPNQANDLKKVCPDLAKELSKILADPFFSNQEVTAYKKNIEALERADSGDLEGSIEMLKSNLLQNSSSMQMKLLLGDMYMKIHRPEAALDLFSQILRSPEAMPKQIRDEAELRSGNCLDVMHSRQAAMDIYQRIIGREKSFAREAAYFYLKMPFSESS